LIGLGTLLNCALIVAGGIVGLLFKNLFTVSMQDSLKKACGVSVIFIAIAGAMEGMLKISGDGLTSGKSMLLVLCITIGTIIGELIDIDKKFDNFAIWLRHKTGNDNDTGFIDAFVTASFTVCIGAMAIVGAMEDGLKGNISVLAVKSILDLITIAVLTSSMGKGAIYSAIPVLVFQGLMTIFARMLTPFMTDMAINYISLVGSVLIFCVGINLIWKNVFKVANMLPGLLIAVIFAGLKLF
jgi:uncharacterized membrane protein YqgA involved in biofilm formation